MRRHLIHRYAKNKNKKKIHRGVFYNTLTLRLSTIPKYCSHNWFYDETKSVFLLVFDYWCFVIFVSLYQILAIPHKCYKDLKPYHLIHFTSGFLFVFDETVLGCASVSFCFFAERSLQDLSIREAFLFVPELAFLVGWVAWNTVRYCYVLLFS